MEAQIRHEGDVWVIQLAGQLDLESTEPFQQNVLKHLGQEKVIFDLKDLNFVGSSGITVFVETIKLLAHKNSDQIRICNPGVEFRRILEANGFDSWHMFENEVSARQSFINPPEVARIEPNLEPLFKPTLSDDKEPIEST